MTCEFCKNASELHKWSKNINLTWYDSVLCLTQNCSAPCMEFHSHHHPRLSHQIAALRGRNFISLFVHSHYYFTGRPKRHQAYLTLHEIIRTPCCRSCFCRIVEITERLHTGFRLLPYKNQCLIALIHYSYSLSIQQTRIPTINSGDQHFHFTVLINIDCKRCVKPTTAIWCPTNSKAAPPPPHHPTVHRPCRNPRGE